MWINKLIKFPKSLMIFCRTWNTDVVGGAGVWEGDGPPAPHLGSSVARGFSIEGIYVCPDWGLGILTSSYCHVDSAACSMGGLVNNK